MSNPFFTIIIPTFNSAKTLSACIESICLQQFKNWEVLIIDGQSTDGTVDLAEPFAVRFTEIHITSEKDRGIFDAMNKGIQKAKGNYLIFLGSDDKLYNNEVLANVVNRIQQLNYPDVVYGNVFSEAINGPYDGEFNYSKILKKNICHQSVFFRKGVFEITGLFNLKYKAQADWDHNLKWFLSKDIRSFYINELIAFYADGGFSNQYGDKVFYKDLRSNYLFYGKQSLPLFKRLAVLIYEMAKGIKRGEPERLKAALKAF